METENKKTGGYDAEGVLWHQHSNRLMKKILELWTDKNVPIVDLGCGHNWYVGVFRYNGYDATGFDTENINGSDEDYFISWDLTNTMKQHSFILGTSNVLSLEVGEHIPAEHADAYLDNVARFGGDVIMSWAVKGQAGIGHINCQDNDWVILEMHKRGYKLQGDKTAALRGSVADCHCNWFRKTLMYFTTA